MPQIVELCIYSINIKKIFASVFLHKSTSPHGGLFFESEYKVRKFLKATKLSGPKLQELLDDDDIPVDKANVELEPDCGLRVTVKEVTTMYNAEDYPEVATPRSIAFAFDKANLIEKFYQFMLGKTEIFQGDERIRLTLKRLRQQGRGLWC